MTSGAAEFPLTDQFCRGTILTTIALAVWDMSLPDRIDPVHWDSRNYVVDDGQGTGGVIVFGEGGLVGLFSDTDSPRTPWRSGAPYDLRPHIAPVPDVLQPLVTQGLEYLQDTWEDFQGPVVTACFWSTGERLEAAEPWVEVVEHGAHAVAIEASSSDDEALAALQDTMELTAVQTTLAYALFLRRMTAKELPVQVQPWERELLAAAGIVL